MKNVSDSNNEKPYNQKKWNKSLRKMRIKLSSIRALILLLKESQS